MAHKHGKTFWHGMVDRVHGILHGGMAGMWLACGWLAGWLWLVWWLQLGDPCPLRAWHNMAWLCVTA